MNKQAVSRFDKSTSSSRSSSNSTKMSSIIVSLLALLVSISAFSTRSQLQLADAKPLQQNQNQVKFRRLPPKEFTALLGSSITIECEAGGSPSPTIHWLKNGKRIQQTQLDENLLDDGLPSQSGAPVDDINRIALSSTRSRLFIDCADTEDEATYTCVAENAFSRVASNTKLNLIRPLAVQQQQQQQSGSTDNNLLAAAVATGSEQAAADPAQEADLALSAMPQCLSQRNLRSSEPARIHMWTHNIVEVMRNDIVLFCRSNIGRVSARQQELAALSELLISNKLASTAAKSQKEVVADQQQQQQQQPSSRASVGWTLPDDKLVSQEHKDKYEILETGDLLIKDLRWEDMGSYVCTVSNELGSDSISTFVYPASVRSAKSKRATLSQAAFKALA